MWKNFELESPRVFRVALVNDHDQFLLFVGFYWYACAVADNLFLMWRQFHRQSLPRGEVGEVQFHLVDLNRLSPISDIDAALAASDDDGQQGGIYYNGDAIAKSSYVPAFAVGSTKIKAPKEFSQLGTALVIADIGSSAGYEAEVHIAILEFDFQGETVKSYPQDWFNKGSFDFGYQWISRVWRDEKGQICGDGVRVGEFRLDSTGRHLDQSFFGLQ